MLTSRLPILALTSKTAQKAGCLNAQLEQQGKPIGLRDTLKAATAMTRGYSVATRNQEHFEQISGVEIITP